MRASEGSYPLSDSSSAATQRPVWLLLFDPLPTITEASPADDHAAFDQLEASGIVFEQYLIQEVRASSSLDDYFGGAAAIQEWADAAELSSASLIWLQICPPSDAEIESGLVTAPALTALMNNRVLRLSVDQLRQPDSALSSALQAAKLVLITAAICDAAAPLQAASQVLAQLQTLADRLFSPLSAPQWLVTGFRGQSKTIEPPLESGADEPQFHVPLWCSNPESAGTRLQWLCGSFDLLPTIAELLRPEISTPVADSPPALQAPLSLLTVRRQHPENAARLLRIQHDKWTGLRTTQYFLVQPELQEQADSDDLSESPRPKLYLKPEDYWNINNSIVAFTEIADQMSVMPESEDGRS
jgi:hypothetical protein